MKRIILTFLFYICSTAAFSLGENDMDKINELGENLKLNIKVTIPAQEISYLIYVDNKGKKEETLNLPSFLLSEDKDKFGFVEECPKVCVKRVVNNKMEDLTMEEKEKIEYTLINEKGYINDSINLKTPLQRNILSFLSKDELQSMRNFLGDKYEISTDGDLISENQKYIPTKDVHMAVVDGELIIRDEKNSNITTQSILTEKKIEAYINKKNNLEITGLNLRVKIN